MSAKITRAKLSEAIKHAEFVGIAPCSGIAFSISKPHAEDWLATSIATEVGLREKTHVTIQHGGALVILGVPSTDPGALEVVP